jgi:hypothetical protein
MGSTVLAMVYTPDNLSLLLFCSYGMCTKVSKGTNNYVDQYRYGYIRHDAPSTYCPVVISLQFQVAIIISATHASPEALTFLRYHTMVPVGEPLQLPSMFGVVSSMALA